MIPAMTPSWVHDYLRRIGASWQGKGVAIELGSWLGATAVPLLEGLREAGYNKPFYAYDRWEANREQVRKAREQGVKITNKQDLLPLFQDNVLNDDIRVFCQKGNISGTLKWPSNTPVEICLFDAPKQNPIFEHAVRQLGPSFIPDVTVWGLLDYYWHRDRPTEKKREAARVPVRFINRYHQNFSLMAEWGHSCACAFFRYRGGVDWENVEVS